MKRILFTTLFIVGLIVSAMPQAHARKEDKAAKELVAQFVENWNKHDPKKMASLWADDGSLINPAGRVAQGRENIEKLFEDEQSGPFKNSTMEMKVSTVRSLERDVIFLDVDANLTGVSGAEGKNQTSYKHHVVILAEKKKGDWRFLDVRPYSFKEPVQSASPSEKK